MAIRTTATAVRGIIEIDDSIADSAIDPFIETASAIVDDVCDTDTSEYTDARLELIERWLSAHFWAIREPRAIQQQAGPVMEMVESKVDLGFNITRYGQQALLLDTEGGLASLQKSTEKGKKRATLFWAGKDPE